MMMIELQQKIPAKAVLESASTWDPMNSKIHVRHFSSSQGRLHHAGCIWSGPKAWKSPSRSAR